MKNQLTPKDLIDRGICPTCYDKENNNILYGDKSDKMVFENDDFECFLCGNPRSDGHIIISSKEHYRYMMEIPDELCKDIFLFSKTLMKIMMEVYKCECVYLCTMCDGPMNHFHLQLIPRYAYEERGSKNFVKERKKYIEDNEKLELLRKLLEKHYSFD